MTTISAKAIRAELEREDNIQTLWPGSWHLPFVNADDLVACAMPDDSGFGGAENLRDYAISRAIKLSVARCASTAYKTVDGFDMTLDRAIALHDKLVGSRPLHASPCEHVAQADRFFRSNPSLDRDAGDEWGHPDEHRNFVGFRQYRAQIEIAA